MDNIHPVTYGLQPSSINFWKNNALVEALRETTGDLRLRSELPYACPGELCITRLRRKRWPWSTEGSFDLWISDDERLGGMPRTGNNRLTTARKYITSACLEYSAACNRSPKAHKTASSEQDFNGLKKYEH